MPGNQKLHPLTPLWFQILAALKDRPNHGYGIIKMVEEMFEGGEAATGPYYLALRRMAEEGLVEEVSMSNPGDTRRKFYKITPPGRRALLADASRMAKLVDVVLQGRAQ